MAIYSNRQAKPPVDVHRPLTLEISEHSRVNQKYCNIAGTVLGCFNKLLSVCSHDITPQDCMTVLYVQPDMTGDHLCRFNHSNYFTPYYITSICYTTCTWPMAQSTT